MADPVPPAKPARSVVLYVHGDGPLKAGTEYFFELDGDGAAAANPAATPVHPKDKARLKAPGGDGSHAANAGHQPHPPAGPAPVSGQRPNRRVKRGVMPLGEMFPPRPPDDYDKVVITPGGGVENLFSAISQLEYDLPHRHMGALLDWTHTEQLQIGLRRQPAEYIARLATHDACGERDAEVLTFTTACEHMKRFHNFVHEVKNDLRFQAIQDDLIIRDTLLPKAINSGPGPDDVRPFNEEPLGLAKFLDEDLRGLVKYFPLTLAALRPDLVAATDDDFKHSLEYIEADLMAGEAHQGLGHIGEGLKPASGDTGSQIAGFSGIWREVVLCNRATNDVILGPVKVPVGLYKTDGSCHDFVRDGIPTDSENNPKFTTEGYHIFRLPAPKAGIDKFDRDADARRKTQLKRDFQLMQARFVKILRPKRRDVITPNVSVNRAYKVFADILETDFGKLDARQGALEGAFLISPSNKSGRSEIHVFPNLQSLGPSLKHLQTLQDKARHKHTLALSAVSFIAGQLYSKPEYGFGDKFWGNLVKLKKPKKLVISAVAAAIIGATAMFAAPLVVAGVAVGCFGVKRLWISEKIEAPADILRNPNLMALTAGDLTDQEREEFDEYLRSSDKKANNATEGRLKSLWTSLKVKARQTNDLLLTPPKEVEALNKGLDAVVEHHMSLENDVGNLMRRSFVHFRDAHAEVEKAKQAVNAHERGDRSPQYIAAAGKALHHLEKGWRFMAPAVIFFDVAWEQQRKATAAWDKHSHSAAKIMMDEFLAIYENENFEVNRKNMLDMFNEILRNNRLGLLYKWLKRGANAAGAKMRLTVKQEAREGVFKQQLNSFLFHAFPEERDQTQRDFPNIPRDEAEMIGGPELYAEWQMRDGYLEPYQPRTNALRDKSRAATNPRDGMKRLVEKFQWAGTDSLRKDVYRRLTLYHQVGKIVGLPSASMLGPKGGKTPLKTSMHIEIKSLTIVNAWENANSLKGKDRYKRLTQSMRSWYRRQTWREKAMSGLSATGDLVLGIWSSIAFGNIDLGLRYKPTRLELGMHNEKKSLFEHYNDSGVWTGKLSDAGTRFNVSMGFTACVLVTENFLNEQADKRLSYNVSSTGILTRAARDRAVLGKMANPRTVPSDLSGDKLVDLAQQGESYLDDDDDDDQSQLSEKDMKQLAAYVGANLIKDIAESMTTSRQAMDQLVEFQRREFQQPEVGLLDKVARLGHTKTAFRQLKWRIQPLAEYYAGMDQLDASLSNFLIYLEMHRNWGMAVEQDLLNLMGVKSDDYAQFNDGKDDEAMGIHQAHAAKSNQGGAQ